MPPGMPFIGLHSTSLHSPSQPSQETHSIADCTSSGFIPKIINQGIVRKTIKIVIMPKKRELQEGWPT